MPSADPGAPTVRPADVERWLTDLGLEPVDRAERDGIASWDLVLDGRRRFDLRVTIILDPALALICWAHFAPPISDMFRKSYRKLLRWNDEFPFAKFSIGEDERPLLAVELPIADAASPPTADQLGLALARIVGLADRLLDESAGWLWIGGKIPDMAGRERRNAAFQPQADPTAPEMTDGEPDPDEHDGSAG
jgi:putative sensory transduction regulator